jgi:CMP-N-acetylneuraminic acid synthetase
MTDRVVAIVPVKATSRRVPGKNLRPFAGLPLFEHFLARCVPDGVFDARYVDTDSPAVAATARRLGWAVLERAPHLAADDANGNDLLVHHAEQVDADVYVQLFVTAPLLRPDTIRESCRVLATEPDPDSVFTATEIHSWFWFRDKPVNYDPRQLPRSQDAEPVLRETTGLYAIRRSALQETRCRIGSHPHPLLVNWVEGVDVDDEIDFQAAEALWYAQVRDGTGE